MGKPTPIDSELLVLYLAGEADDAQQQAVAVWAAASPDNAAELTRMKTLWDLGGTASEVPEVDVDMAWSRVETRIAEEEGRRRIRPIGGGASGWTRWFAAAAVLAGLVFAVRWFFQPRVDSYMAVAEAVQAELKDGSRAVLSPGTSMDLRLGRTRQVQLRGEAYFEVVRDSVRPFEVECGDVLVTVLGTAFEVSAYDTADAVLVRVRSGRVRVGAGGDTLELTAGQHARYDNQKHVLERRSAPPAEVWGIRILQFEEASLVQVVQQLERLYKVPIDVRHAAIGRCTLTAEFDDEPIEVILGVIAETFGLELSKDSNGYVLDGQGC